MTYKHYNDTPKGGLFARLCRALKTPEPERGGKMVRLPTAPRTASPVPWLTSIHAAQGRGPYGSSEYPGNCGGYLIRDLLRFFDAKRVFDPMTGSGTCRDVCKELRIKCVSKDLKSGFDACDVESYPYEWLKEPFDFIWAHPPYYRQKKYSDDPRDLSTAPTLDDFLARYEQFIKNCAEVLAPGGHFAILMGNYMDPEYEHLDLVFFTKRFCYEAGLRPSCTEIIRFSHGASSSHKSYRSSFIPGLHDTVTIVGHGEQAEDRQRTRREVEEAEETPHYLNGQGSHRD